jgi:serine/tyrosine/threonine adenylyltransferase
VEDKKRGWHFDTSYLKLPESLYTFTMPSAVHLPRTVLFNYQLAAKLGLQFDVTDEDEIASLFSGNTIILGSQPLAQAYAGHQFGHFTMLGDGRAILLGEHLTIDNRRFDIQLKGAGRTAYSRGGDGRATLRSMLREYIISEAMHGLNIPSSRSLAVVASGQKVYREDIHEGAILTRIASSHLRVGTFEYAKQFLSVNELQLLTNYVIDRHYPEIKDSLNPALQLLEAVMKRQISLIVHWMRVGFIHGVMNTDNMSVAGETFDYGPCAFMNAYNPATVFSSIDVNGRYAFGNQPMIAQWNLSCLADALLPLIHANKSEAIRLAETVLDAFPSIYEKQWTEMMGRKLGIKILDDSDSEKAHIAELLDWMEMERADYTNTFQAIQTGEWESTSIYSQLNFKQWYATWKLLLDEKGISLDDAIAIMQTMNPVFIPRNHLVEKALDSACLENDFTLFNTLLDVARSPYSENDEHKSLKTPPETDDRLYKTYCGT